LTFLAPEFTFVTDADSTPFSPPPSSCDEHAGESVWLELTASNQRIQKPAGAKAPAGFLRSANNMKKLRNKKT